MTDRTINIITGPDKIVNLDADDQGQFIAFTNNKTVITNDNLVTVDIEVRFPIIRRLNSKTFLIADSRTNKLSNGHIFNFNGELIKSFLIGDGIQDIVIHHEKIIATYFDEGVYGSDGPNNDGLAVFDLLGQQEFGINSSVGELAISDCYCICKHTKNTVLFYAYTDFKVSELNLETFGVNSFDTPSDFSGASAISCIENKIIFHSSYNDKTSFFCWDKGKNEVKIIGSYSPTLTGIGNGKFLAFGDNGYTIINTVE